MIQPPRHVLTNVRLPLPLLKSLKHRAVEERRPAAALVREAVEQYLLLPPRDSATRTDVRWLRSVIGSAGSSSSAPRDLSTDHDHYLYGAPRRGRHRRRHA